MVNAPALDQLRMPAGFNNPPLIEHDNQVVRPPKSGQAVPDKRSGQGRQQREPEQQEVWHCIRLDNVMNLPWTTAPAEIVKDGVILGQDTLNFTPVKEKGKVYVHGELWNAQSEEPIGEGERVIVTEVKGMIVKVKKERG